MGLERGRKLTDTNRFRQLEDGVIESQSNGAYNVTVNGRSQPYAGLCGVWLDADNATGDAGRIAFAYGNPLLPLFFDRKTKPGATKVLVTETPISLTFYWYSNLADFSRSNAITAEEFDTSSLVAATMPAGGRFHRWLSDYRVRDAGTGLSIPQTPGEITPRASWPYDGTDAQLALGLSNGAYESEWESNYPLEPGQTRDHTISLYERLSLAIVEDRVLVEVGYEIETATNTEVDDGEGGTTTETSYDYTTIAMLFVLEADPDGSTVTMVYSKNLTSFGSTRLYDILVTGGRVAVFFEGLALWHFAFSDGSDEQELDLSEVLNSNSLTLTGSNATDGFMPSSVGDSRVFFGGGGPQVCCVDLEDNSLTWAVGGATVDSVLTTYYPIGVCPDSNTLVCVREQILYETVTDYELSLPTEYAWVDTPEPVAEVRSPEQARGHSRKAGIACLSLTDGAEVGYTEFSGTEADGFLVDSITDYYTDTEVEEWSHPANPISPVVDPPNYPGPYPFDRGRGFNEVPTLVWAAEVFYGATPERSPGDNVSGTYVESETGSGTTAGNIDHLCVGGSRSTFYNTYTGPGIYAWETDYFNNVVLPQVEARFNPPSGSPADAIPSALSALISLEQSRATNGDWIRAEAYLIQTSTLLTYEDSTTIINGSQEFTKILVNISNRENGLSYGPPNDKLGGTFFDAGGFIPGYLDKLEYGELQQIGASVEYYQAQIAYNATDGSGDKPYLGTSQADFIGPSTGGGHTASFTHRAIWRPVGTQVARLRTVRPRYSWDKAPLVGGRRILCPLYEASATTEPLRWAAIHPTTGALVWQAELDLDAWFTEGSIGVGSSIFTPYNLGGVHYLAEVDASSGTVATPQEIPDNQPITDLIYGDGTLWPPFTDYGIT